MNKLLSANFARIKKDRIFWWFTAFVAVYAFLTAIVGIINIDILKEQGKTFDDLYFRVTPSLGFFILVFTSFFIGTEYSDGTLRNKIIMGNSRTYIYLSNLVTTIALFFMFLVLWTTISLIAMPTLGKFRIGLQDAIIYTVIIMFVIATFSAIFTFIAMLCNNKARTLLISIILMLGFLMVFSSFDNAVKEPKMITDMYDMTVNGVVEKLEPYPNPKYLDVPLRTVFEYILDILPTGQSFKVTWLEVTNPIRMIVFSIINTIIITASGVLLFKKKDLK